MQQYHQSQATAGAAGKSLSVLQACRQICQQPTNGVGGRYGYGFLNLYAGLGVTVIGAMPGVAIYFGVYQYCKTYFLNRQTFGNTQTSGTSKTLSIDVLNICVQII